MFRALIMMVYRKNLLGSIDIGKMVIKLISSNVRDILKTMKENPVLVRELNESLIAIFAASNVDLTAEERNQFFEVLAELASGNGKSCIIPNQRDSRAWKGQDFKRNELRN
jgi:hypothetical protein